MESKIKKAEERAVERAEERGRRRDMVEQKYVFSLEFPLIFLLYIGYDGHNHVHHSPLDHQHSVRRPCFGIQSLCHEEDLKVSSFLEMAVR